MIEKENITQAQLEQTALKAARTLVGNTYQPNKDALNAAGVKAQEGDNG